MTRYRITVRTDTGRIEATAGTLDRALWIARSVQGENDGSVATVRAPNGEIVAVITSEPRNAVA